MCEDVASTPSLAQLVAACRSLKGGTAAGIHGIPPEAFKNAAANAGRAMYPLALKIFATGRCPNEWRESLYVPIPKPSKPFGSLDAWRAIALAEPSMKAVAAAVRAQLVPHLKQLLRKGQGGAFKGTNPECAKMIVKSHVRRLAQRGQCGSIIFLDGVSAFYSVIREFLVDTVDEQRK